MKKFKILTVLLFIFYQGYSQVTDSAIYYVYFENELLQIDRDRFKIITGTNYDSFDLDKGDTILAKGKVEYFSNGFVKLTSDNERSRVMKSIIITESYDKRFNEDSIRIRFTFPFNGVFEIDVLQISDYNSYITNSKDVTIAKLANKENIIHFDIYNRKLKDDYHGDYLGLMVFKYYSRYELKNKNTNVLDIDIPDLTNSFFARYFINGEYAKIEEHVFRWRNRVYERTILQPGW